MSQQQKNQHNSLTRRELLRLLGIAGATTLMPDLNAANQTPILRSIPSSGEKLPVIGLGTWQTFDVGSLFGARRPLEDVLSAFVRLGGRVIDSSPMYGRSEEVVGELATKLGINEKLFVATKVWTTGRSEGVQQMEESLRLLRRKRIDLMQVHNLVDMETHLKTLADRKRQGGVRYIGITHYSESAYGALESALRKHQLDFLQINYSIAERRAENRVLPLAKERGVAVIVNRPFSSGSMFRAVAGKSLPSFAAAIGCSSWAQLFLKWIVAHPAVTCAIPATSKVHHLEDNMRAGFGALPDAKMRERIAAAVG